MPKKIRESEVSEAVRAFLQEAFEGGGVVIEDESGRARGGVFPYTYYEASEQERERAWQWLQQLQQRVGRSMREQGITEEDADRVLQEDD